MASEVIAVGPVDLSKPWNKVLVLHLNRKCGECGKTKDRPGVEMRFARQRPEARTDE